MLSTRLAGPSAPRAPLVAVGAVLGTGLRWSVEAGFESGGFSGEIMLLNVIGSVLLGWLAGQGVQSSSALRYFAGTGFAGGLTTFSTFTIDVALRFDAGDVGGGLSLSAATMALAVIGAGLGFRIGRAW